MSGRFVLAGDALAGTLVSRTASASAVPCGTTCPGCPRGPSAPATPRGSSRFPPGTQQQYNGIDYYVAGLLIEKVTGDSYAREVERRIISPLRLRDTSVPAATTRTCPAPHAHGYVAVTENGATTLHDVSRQSPWAWAEPG